MAAAEDFQLDRGSFWSQRVEFFESDGTTAKDLTGYTFRMQVRAKAGASGEPLIELTDGNGRVVYESGDRTLGVVYLQVGADESDAAFANKTATYHYDLERVPDGDPEGAKRVLQGRFRVTAEVTV